MQLLDIRLQDYRNITWAELDLRGQRHFLLGPNGQGKTNLIEAIHLLSTLKSFRQADTQALIKKNAPQAQILYTIAHPELDTSHIHLTLSSKGKSLSINESKVATFSEWVGLCPSTVICSDDIMLIRGGPAGRRRLLDSLLASTDVDYLNALKKYHVLLAERNALLKKEGTPTALFNSFETMLAQQAAILIIKRTQGVKEMGTLFTPLYLRLSQLDEAPLLCYKPDIENPDEQRLLETWAHSRKRDQILKTTTKGPHRDDFSFELQGNLARHFSSEGQQRSLVIALKLAHLKYLEAKTNNTPIVLADDVLGQLDPQRQKQFWSIVDDRYQLIATGTVPPPIEEEWKIWEVAEGRYGSVKKIQNSF